MHTHILAVRYSLHYSINRLQNAQISPRQPRDALCQLKCCRLLHDNANRSRVSLSNTFSNRHFYSTTCIVLQWAVSVINKLRRRPTFWRHHLSVCQRTVVDAVHCCGWTQIFGGKASEPETSWPVETRYFTYPN